MVVKMIGILGVVNKMGSGVVVVKAMPVAEMLIEPKGVESVIPRSLSVSDVAPLGDAMDA